METSKAITVVKDKLEPPTEGVSSVTEFLSEVVEALKDTDILEALTKAEPWLNDAMNVGEAIPLVNAVVKAVKVLVREKDPRSLALIAFTQTYKRAMVEAIKAVGSPSGDKQLGGDMRSALKNINEFDLDSLSLDRPIEHPFVRAADTYLEVLTEIAGYTPTQRRQIVDGLHERFAANLRILLSHGDTSEKFKPLVDWSALPAADRQAYRALEAHAEHEERLFTEARVLRAESFALSDVYVDGDCGSVTWDEIQKSKPDDGSLTNTANRTKGNPFSEECGGRTPLLDHIRELLGDRNFRDVIVLQGVAGSGKSAFTLKLCAKLREEGLHPIRVRMRDLRFELPFQEALAEAIVLSDDRLLLPPVESVDRPSDILLGGRIFDEPTTYGNAKICRFVVILDGWDEISINAREGFESRVEKMLDQVRSEFIRPTRNVSVRVIVTGRPSVAVNESRFLRANTRILTMRPLTPAQVRTLWNRLDAAAKAKRLGELPGSTWQMRALKDLEPALMHYERAFELVRPAEMTGTMHEKTPGSMEILGHPLLAHITARLMSSWPGEIEQLIQSPTSLYRNLIDMTCANAGQPDGAVNDVEDLPRVAGNDLRKWLRRTAVAMTVGGEESISRDELKARLIKGWGKGEWNELQKGAEHATKEHPLTTLMVSYYFTGGLKHLGCEFVHKSFREYRGIL